MKNSALIAFLALAQNENGVKCFLVPNQAKGTFTTTSTLKMGVPKPSESAYAAILAKLEKAGFDMKNAVSSRLSASPNLEDVQPEIETELQASIEEVREAIADVEGAVGSTVDTVVAKAEIELETAIKDMKEAVETDDLKLMEKAENELEQAITDVEKAVAVTDTPITVSNAASEVSEPVKSAVKEDPVLESSSSEEVKPISVKPVPEAKEDVVKEVTDEITVSTTASSEVSETVASAAKEAENILIASAEPTKRVEVAFDVEATIGEKALDVAQVEAEVEKSVEAIEATTSVAKIDPIVEEKTVEMMPQIEKSTEVTVVASTDATSSIQEVGGKDAEVILASATTDVHEGVSAVEGNSIIDTVVSAAGAIIEAGESLANAVSSLQ